VHEGFIDEGVLELIDLSLFLLVEAVVVLVNFLVLLELAVTVLQRPQLMVLLLKAPLKLLDFIYSFLFLRNLPFSQLILHFLKHGLLFPLLCGLYLTLVPESNQILFLSY
jgi:hypothetical protein